MRFDHQLWRFPSKRRMARDHLVRHDTECVQIGAMIEGRIACGLLRSDVRWSAECDANLRDAQDLCFGG